MPVNFTQKAMPELFIMDSNGTITKLGKIQQGEIINTSSYDDIYDDYVEPWMSVIEEDKATFEVTWNPTVDTLYLLLHGRLPYNNWRRMHGLPVRRKKRRYKLK